MYQFLVVLFLITHSITTAQTTGHCFERCSNALREGSRVNQANFFQNNKMNYYDIRHLKLEITVQPKSNFIEAKCNYTIGIKQALDTFAIEFKQAMVLDSVFINNTKTAFTRSEDHIYVPFGTIANVGAVYNVSFYYKGSVAKGFFAGTDENGLDYTASVSESFQAREWFPAKQLLDDKIDSTDIWITTGAAYKAGSNGLLKEVVDLPGDLKQYRWSCRYPLSYYLPMVAVGNYMEYNNFAKPAAIAPDSILIQNYLVNNLTYFNSNKPLIDKTAPFLEKMSELFGLYPYYKEKYGHAQANIGGGMEHATMTTIKNFEEHLVAHELGHQWFGDNVTCASWNDIWLNEGFATYIQVLMQEKLPTLFPTAADATIQDLQQRAMNSPGGSVYVPAAEAYNEARIFDYRLSYAKGATAVHNLRFEMQSDTLFFNTLKRYQQQFKDSFASTADFKHLAEQVSGKDLTHFFEQKIYGAGYPTYNITYLKHGNDSLILQISQTVSAPTVTPLFAGLMEYKVLSPQGDTVIKINQTSNNQTFAIYYPKTPTGVVVDPNHWVLDKPGLIKEGVSTEPAPDRVKVYPNPVITRATVRMPPNLFNGARIIDVDGRVLSKYSIAPAATSFEPNLRLPSGVYFLQMIGSKESVVKKILVIKQ
jgi:aminopeptidase N